MNKTFILKTEKIRTRAADFILGLSLEPIYHVVIMLYNEVRSLRQNRLYWRWNGILEKQNIGYTKDEWHELFKEKFLIPIFIENYKQHIMFAEMWVETHKLFQEGNVERALKYKKGLINMVSTTDASVKEMRIYLNDIDKHAVSLGVYLPRPKDRGLI